MTDAQIDYMLEMHRYLMNCEIRKAVLTLAAENGNEDYSAANLAQELNDTKWKEFAKWFKVIRDE